MRCCPGEVGSFSAACSVSGSRLMSSGSTAISDDQCSSPLALKTLKWLMRGRSARSTCTYGSRDVQATPGLTSLRPLARPSAGVTAPLPLVPAPGAPGPASLALLAPPAASARLPAVRASVRERPSAPFRDLAEPRPSAEVVKSAPGIFCACRIAPAAAAVLDAGRFSITDSATGPPTAAGQPDPPVCPSARGRACLEPGRRIDGLAVAADLEIQLRGRPATGVPGGCDNLAGFHLRADSAVQPVVMPVKAEIARAVVHDHQQPQTRQPVGIHHPAGRHRAYRRVACGID